MRCLRSAQEEAQWPHSLADKSRLITDCPTTSGPFNPGVPGREVPAAGQAGGGAMPLGASPAPE